MRPKEHRQIVRAVLEKEEKEREQEIASMMPRLRSLVDDATYITGLEDGVAALIALYILCTSHNINTIKHYQDIKTRLMRLIDHLQDNMLRRFPPQENLEILATVRGKQHKKDQEKQVRDIAETMCLSVDESPYMIAMGDGAAAVAAMYTLCVEDGLNTVMEYLELKDRLDGLLGDMHDKMREIYPVPAQGESGDKSKQCIGADTAQEECT